MAMGGAMSAVDRLKLRFLTAMCVVLALGMVSSWGWAWSQRSLTLESQRLAWACTYMGLHGAGGRGSERPS